MAEMIAGLIVNPVAGMGGSVGLKGTDGAEIVAEAQRRGARKLAPQRTVRALVSLRKSLPAVHVLVPPGTMGEDEASEAGVEYDILPMTIGELTSSEDTKQAARLLKHSPVGLILFAGGDGTARDLAGEVGMTVTTLGVPCGVKNYSAVFAKSPEAAGQVAAEYLSGQLQTTENEILDYDENSMRAGKVSVSIRGMLKVPSSVRFMQGGKSAAISAEERSEQDAIAKYIVEEMDQNFQYVLGPGSTTSKLGARLGVEKTLLGVDVVRQGKLFVKDATAAQLEPVISEGPAKLIIAPIGGQGFILGRGNQQLTPTVLRAIGKENMIVICARSKLLSLPERKFFVDTGDPVLDEELRGFWRVTVGYREFAVVRVERA